MSFLNEQNPKPSLEEICCRLIAVEQKLQLINAAKDSSATKEQYLDIASTCQYLGMGRTTLYEIMNKGSLAYTYVGRQRRILLSDIKKYINSTYVAAKPSIL